MIRGLYSAAGGMQAMSIQQDATAHNVSHAMKPGYRREVVSFESIGWKQDLISPSATMTTDYTPGIHEYTGGRLDAALDGDGFFSVQGPGGPLFTRAGIFQLNGLGQLVTPDGLRVEGKGGPISLPLDTDVNQLEILPNGNLVLAGNPVGQLKVSTFEDMNQVERAGSSFLQPLPDNKVIPSKANVRQGYRELGNTTVVHEMVQMISGARLFEAAQRAITQISDTISLNTRPR